MGVGEWAAQKSARGKMAAMGSSTRRELLLSSSSTSTAHLLGTTTTTKLNVTENPLRAVNMSCLPPSLSPLSCCCSPKGNKLVLSTNQATITIKKRRHTQNCYDSETPLPIPFSLSYHSLLQAEQLLLTGNCVLLLCYYSSVSVKPVPLLLWLC